MKVLEIKPMTTVDPETGSEIVKLYLKTEEHPKFETLLHPKKSDGNRMDVTETLHFLQERKTSWQDGLSLVDGQYGMYYTVAKAVEAKLTDEQSALMKGLL